MSWVEMIFWDKYCGLAQNFTYQNFCFPRFSGAQLFIKAGLYLPIVAFVFMMKTLLVTIHLRITVLESQEGKKYRNNNNQESEKQIQAK